MDNNLKINRFDLDDLHLANPVDGEINVTFDDVGRCFIFDGNDWCYVSETDINNILK